LSDDSDFIEIGHLAFPDAFAPLPVDSNRLTKCLRYWRQRHAINQTRRLVDRYGRYTVEAVAKLEPRS